MGIAALCWAIWKACNKACFDRIIIKHPVLFFYHICALIKYWAGLFGEADKKLLEDGVKILLQIAVKLKEEREATGQLMLQNEDGGQ